MVRRSFGTCHLLIVLSTLPFTLTVPEVGVSSFSSSRRNVDLPEPGGPDEEDELALVDLGGHVVESRPAAGRIELGDVLQFDHEAPRYLPPTPRRRRSRRNRRESLCTT